MVINKTVELVFGMRVNERTRNLFLAIMALVFVMVCSFVGASEKSLSDGKGNAFVELFKKPKTPFFAVKQGPLFPFVEKLPEVGQLQKLNTKQKNVLNKEVNTELNKMGEVASSAFALIKKGKLAFFDPLCSDTACQVRAVSTIILYQFIREKTVEQVSDLAPSDRLFLAQNLVLSKAKRLDGALEFISLNGFKQLFKKIKAPEKLIGDCKRLVSENALQLLLDEAGEKIKQDFKLVNLPIFRYKTVATFSGVAMLPCFLSLYACLLFCEKKGIPLVARCCNSEFAQPFTEKLSQEPLEMGTKLLDPDKNPVVIFSSSPNKADIQTDDPVFVIDGIAQDPESLKKLSYEQFKNCLLANAAQHGQVGGPFKKYSELSSELKNDLSCYTDLPELFKKIGCPCSLELKEAYNQAFKETSSALKIFRIVHIVSSTFGRRFEFVTIPQEAVPVIKKTTNTFEQSLNDDLR